MIELAPGLVWRDKNVLPVDLIAAAKQIVESGPEPQPSYGRWEKEFTYQAPPIMLNDLAGDLRALILGTALEKFNLSGIDFNACGCIYTRFTEQAYIPWHSDDEYRYAITIYVTPDWEVDWGGWLLYEHDKRRYAVGPEFNTAVMLKTPIPHAVVPSTQRAAPRTSIQIFVP